MPGGLTPRLLVAAATALLALHLAHDLTGLGGDTFGSFVALWFQSIVFTGCGVVTLGRAVARREERTPWALVGTGLILYGAGSVYFNVVPNAPFPSVADVLWLSLYPLTFAAVALLVRRRFGSLDALVWLDGLIGGAVVAAVGATAVFTPVFALTIENGAASAARLAYPLGDLLLVGFVVVVWSLSGRRFDGFWALLGSGFALLALGDSVYVVQASAGTYEAGSLLDLPYAVATMLIAAAAWIAPREVRAPETSTRGRVVLPVGFALTAVALAAYDTVADLNLLASALVLVTLLAVVLRFGLTLAWLTRQRTDLRELAATDPLTGLANHRALHERLGQELERARRYGQPVAVVALDIDHFKAINDTYGHSEGDAALQAIADVLRTQARPYDLVARIGGEEFVMVLPDVDGDTAYAIGERCRLALVDLLVHGSPVSCSGGVASFPEDDGGGHRLLELADGALYWAKRSGRAQVRRFDPREVVLLSSAEQQDQVREVLATPGALTPVFQPIVELATGRVAGFESLTRFRTEPVRPPDAWFAQARRCGMGPALEARAMELCLAVPDRPAGTFLTLNVSPAALVTPEVAAVLPEDLSDIVIELTEDELFSTDEALDLELSALRARGARIAVDDAGAGYAGLQQVIRIKPDIIKLDRSLVEGLHRDSSKIALVEALARFASTTGAAVCGEGIEEVDELLTLARFDVTYGQGYALARPAADWPGIDAAVALSAAADVRWGMRLAPSVISDPKHVSFGGITDALANVRTTEDIAPVVAMIERLAHADECAISTVLFTERCVQTLSHHTWGPVGERFFFDDYPTTERVCTGQAAGQVVTGDPAADQAELEVLQRSGFQAVLLLPIVFRAETVGLLELYRRAARPWTATEIDQARALAHQLGPALPAPADTAAA